MDERAQEGAGLGQFAGREELAHLLGERGDQLGRVEQFAPFGQHPPRLIRCLLKLLFALLVLADPVGGVSHLQVGGLDQPPDAVERPVDLRQLMLDRLQLAPLLMGQSVHLLIDHLDQLADVALG
ncbi:MAG: hypothetical protein OXG27_09310 [Chloroflexi bacterium]|nr:hypothetical protein [Chloroflexota bacterium]